MYDVPFRRSQDSGDGHFSLAELYLGPADSPCARTTDATVFLHDGELPVHVSYLCHGVLEETVSLALEKGHSPGDPLKIPLPGCSTAQVAPVFQLLYSLRADEAADGMSMANLMRAGLIADSFSFTATRAVVEQAVPGKCIKRQVISLDADSLTSAISEENVQSLLMFETIESGRVAKLCGMYHGKCSLLSRGFKNAKNAGIENCKRVLCPSAIRLSRECDIVAVLDCVSAKTLAAAAQIHRRGAK